MIKLVASDLDGTIIDKNNLIHDTNIKAINDIHANNINFVICTGKTYPIIKNLCSEFNANYGIFGNGNQIINLQTGEEIYKKLLSMNDITNCINIAQSNNLHIHLYTNQAIITEKLEYMDLRNFKLRNSSNSTMEFIIVNDILDYVKNHSSEICKLVISSSTSLDSVKERILENSNVDVTTIRKYGEYKDTIINKEYEYLDVSPKGINKSNALQILQNYLKITNSEVMAVGDNLNDIEMVTNSGIGVSVANGYDELKHVAKYVTKNSVENGGFAEAVYKFIKF